MIPNPRLHFAHRLLRARDWQDRLEFDRVCEWWKSGGAGVCALVGIGGAGKTAIAERFLRVLPSMLPETPDVAKNEALPTPEGLLVFSFYAALNPDNFFAVLAAWLNNSPADDIVEPPSYQQTLRLLRQAGSCLLVLDGLEKVQDDSARSGVFGRIDDGRLRDFVQRLADGYLPGVRAIITTRFPIAELEEEQPPHYLPVAVEEISEAAGINLLRQRGVRGPDVELRRIVNECGRHAFTIDLAGGYIAEFGKGDPNTQLKLGTPEELERAIENELNSRRRAVLRQEYRFARIAKRYGEVLARTDPAALALLERVCLFRRGVDAATLATIFSGRGRKKVKISGRSLAFLDKSEFQPKLDLLAKMRLLEARESSHASAVRGSKQGVYTVHPAIRDGFLAGLDTPTVQRVHNAACKSLEASLGNQSSSNHSDSPTLDLLEEIVYHTLAVGRVEKAWDIYQNKIGGYKNLGLSLGAYERGERVCQMFATGQSPEIAPLPDRLSEGKKPGFISEWALYLEALGRLDAAARCCERHIAMRMEQKDWGNASTGNQNLSEVLLLAGRLTAGWRAANEALRLAKFVGINNSKVWLDSYAYRAHAYALQGNTKAALDDFDNVLSWQRRTDNRTERPLYSLRGVHHTLLLARLDRDEDATRLTEANKNFTVGDHSEQHKDMPLCNLVLGDLVRKRGELAAARDLLVKAHEWAIARDAKELLCWSALVGARIALDARRQQAESSKREWNGFLEEARTNIDEGLRIAHDCGYGIYHIDLLLLRAQVALSEGHAEDAVHDILVALDKGVPPSAESGLPTLLAATDPECGYAWGEAQGRHLLAEAWLLQAAQKLGQVDFAPARFNALSDEVKKLVSDAREQLTQCCELRKKIQDPKIADTEQVLVSLDGGVLTTYPLQPLRSAPESQPVVSSQIEEGRFEVSTQRSTHMAKKHVFLSYCHDNAQEVAELRNDLIAAGETVWWDQDILPGRDLKMAIRQEMEDSYAVVLCLSKEAEARTTSGIFPEAFDAIGVYREYTPGSIFLIPVKLSECKIPPIEIDATRTLNRLRWVNLFPLSERSKGLQQLGQALREAPGHPEIGKEKK